MSMVHEEAAWEAAASTGPWCNLRIIYFYIDNKHNSNADTGSRDPVEGGD